MTKAVIVDDDVHWSTVLVTLIRNNCPQIEVSAICNSATDALEAIQVHQPELLFLDMELSEINPFKLLDKVSKYDFELILMSDQNKDAISAIHYNAVDYLLKPFDIDDLKKAVDKVMRKIEIKLSRKLETVLEQIHHNSLVHNIALPTLEGLQMVAINSIIYCTSNSNYTNFILKDGLKLNICRTLKEVERLLDGNAFIRVHNSYIVNLNEVKKYIKGEGGILVMSDSSSINVSRSYKEQLLKKFQNKYRS
jgi:two-component system LytT family response regulator